MSFRTTALLFGIMIGVLWLFGLMLTLQRNKLDPGFVLPTLARDKTAEIDTVEIDREGQKVVFFKTDSGWKLRIDTHPQALRADDGKVTDIIEDIKKARKSDEADVTRSLAQWGLDKPAEKVILKKKGGDREWILNVGKESPDGTYVYVNSSDRPDDVLAVRRAKLQSVLLKPGAIDKYRSLRLLDISDTAARLVDLKPGAEVKGRELILDKGKDGTWRFQKPPYGPAEYEGAALSKEPTGVRGLLNTLGAIRVDKETDFEPLSRPPFPEDKALLRVDVERTEAGKKTAKTVKETLLIGEKVPGKEQYYARLASDEAVVRVGAKNVETLLEFTRKPDALRSHDLAQIETGKPDVVRVSSGKGLADVVTLYRPLPGEWKVAAPGLRHKAETNAVQGPEGLLAALQGKNQVKDFFDVTDEAKEGKARDKELGLDSPAARVVVWIDGLEKEPAKAAKKDEKKDKKGAKKDEARKGDKEAKKGEAKEEKAPEEPRLSAKARPAVTLSFGNKVGEIVYVKRESPDGSISRVSVPASILKKVVPPEGALAYLDHNLAPFLSFDVARVELKLQDGKQERVFVVEREGETKDKAKAKLPFGGGWLLLQPKNLKDRPNADAEEVQAVLNVLSRLTVQRWVKRVEPKEDLNTYGLKSPAVTAVVTLKKKEGEKAPKTITYEFGSEIKAEKGKEAGVYGVITGGGDLKDIVFVTGAHEVKTLKDAELRDRTVFRFDPAKVKEVKLTITEKIETREPVFERKPPEKTWAVKSGLGKFNLDPTRVDELVHTLSNLKALRYVNFTGPEKGQGLGGEAKLKIEVLMDDGKTRYTLTLGAAQDATGYYAEASTLPQTVFLVAQPNFAGLVSDGVGYFSRK